MDGPANKSALPKNFSAKIMFSSAVGTILIVADVLFLSYLQRHRPHVMDVAAGFITPLSFKGVTYYFSRTDIIILVGLFVPAILWMAGFQIYLWKIRRKQTQPQARRP